MANFLGQSVNRQIKVAIDNSDPKLVQILLGPKYCQLWQYWLIRALFNYDMLSMSQMTKCELSLAIANEQVKYLNEKKRINIEELSNIQRDKKMECLTKVENFYGSGRLLQIRSSKQGEQLKASAEGCSKSIITQFADTGLQDYQDHNKGLHVSDSVSAAVNADFSKECEVMINETISECEKEVKNADTVSGLRNKLLEKIRQLNSDKQSFSLKINTVKEGIIKKMQDNKFLDKDFVKLEYNKLLDYYFSSSKHAINRKNPLYEYTGSKESINNAKKQLRNLSVSYDFSGCIDYAVRKFKAETNAQKKEEYLDIVRVLAINGAHVGSLANAFDTKELKEVALQSIFTIARRVYKVLFDFDRSDIAKFISTIVGKDGKFSDPVSRNVPIFKSSGSPFIKTTLASLEYIANDLQEARESGKANRETGLFNELLDTAKDFWHETIMGEKYVPNTDEEHEGVYIVLYEVLEIVYLSMSTGDDRVVIDYIKEIESKLNKESNSDTAKIYSLLYSILKEYNASKRKEDPTSDTGKWERLWYHFQDRFPYMFEAHQDDINADKMMGSLRMGLYAFEVISKEYDEHQKQRFTKKFRNIDVKVLPGNCLANWLVATHGGVLRANDMVVGQAEQKTKQESQRADENAERAEQIKRVSKAFTRKIRSLDDELQDIVIDSQDEIVEAVVEHVMKHNSSAEQVLNGVIEEIKCNKNQVLRDETVNPELIKIGIRGVPTSLSGINADQIMGAQAGRG
ncbi:hypothetical protein [Wolbachia endosymbiont of Folsomia candida]|uniref:hypothetical protein n=1 Tax=Wolbachia endosymbiont of Folsomia candida TaxID=169402 RepID=UPI000A4EBCA8|nr:hypothetical protein [Wolbachia endosymbiont of Folsomia candida]APR98055.1 hypothetical protein ASM33_01920 [Wolbachia endosymbiont of Folsomia candida]